MPSVSVFIYCSRCQAGQLTIKAKSVLLISQLVVKICFKLGHGLRRRSGRSQS